MNVRMTSTTLLLSFLLRLPPLLRVSSPTPISWQLTSQNVSTSCSALKVSWARGLDTVLGQIWQWKIVFFWFLSFIFLFCFAHHWRWVPWTDFLTPPNCSDSSDRFQGLSHGTEIGSKGGGEIFSGTNISISTPKNVQKKIKMWQHREHMHMLCKFPQCG